MWIFPAKGRVPWSLHKLNLVSKWAISTCTLWGNGQIRKILRPSSAFCVSRTITRISELVSPKLLHLCTPWPEKRFSAGVGWGSTAVFCCFHFCATTDGKFVLDTDASDLAIGADTGWLRQGSKWSSYDTCIMFMFCDVLLYQMHAKYKTNRLLK